MIHTGDTANRTWGEVARVWDRLSRAKKGDCAIDVEDALRLTCDIYTKLETGWTQDEVFGHMKWTEYFDNETDEHLALEYLRETQEAVEKRLKGGKAYSYPGAIVAELVEAGVGPEEMRYMAPKEVFAKILEYNGFFRYEEQIASWYEGAMSAVAPGSTMFEPLRNGR